MLRNEIEAQDDKTSNVACIRGKSQTIHGNQGTYAAIVNEFIDYIIVSKSRS